MSLRRTALVWMTILLAAVGVAAVLIAYTFARREAGGLLDSQLRQIALNAGEGLPDSAGPAVDHDPEDEFVMAIWDAEGRQVHRPAPLVDIPRQAEIGFANVVASGEPWRVYTSSDGQRTVQVAQRLSVREELATSAAVEAALPILVVIPLSWLVIGWAIDRMLRRLDALAHAIATRSTESHDPVPLDGIPTEVASLVTALNSLTRRLHQSLDGQKRFVSDAAHELRTPLAALQIQLDGLSSTDRGTSASNLAALAGGVRRASALVEQLLRLARIGGSENRPTGALDVRDILLASLADHVELAERGRVDLGISRQEDAAVEGNEDDLHVLLDNLISNAVRYTPAGGSVDVSVYPCGDNAVVEILDTGCGIPAAAQDRLFDRFFRAAPPGIEGTGLGLAIVAEIAQRHGYRVTLANRGDGRSGALARIVLPLTDRGAPGVQGCRGGQSFGA